MQAVDAVKPAEGWGRCLVVSGRVQAMGCGRVAAWSMVLWCEGERKLEKESDSKERWIVARTLVGVEAAKPGGERPTRMNTTHHSTCFAR